MQTIVKALLIITIAGAPFTNSCVPVPVPADLDSVDFTPSETDAIEVVEIGRNIIVLPADELNPLPEQLKCIQSAIAETEPSLSLLEPGKFLDAVFPWFEPSLIPKSDEALERTLTRTGVREAIDALSVRYMVLVGDVETFKSDFEGPILLFAGAGWGEDSAEMVATLWDLEGPSLIGTISVKASGQKYLAMWVGVLAIFPRTVDKACQELGKQLALFLTGQKLSEPENEPTDSKRAKDGHLR